MAMSESAKNTNPNYSHRASNAEETATYIDIRQLACEVNAITGWDYDEVYRRLNEEYNHPGITVRKAWELAQPKTEQEIDSFYRSTDSYIFDLMVESHRIVRQSWRSAVLDYITQTFSSSESSLRLLDYGGGVGTDAIYFAQRGLSVDYYDLVGMTSAFALQRFRAKLLPIESISAVTDKYDVIISFEVLEHLTDPIKSAEALTAHLKPTGLLFLTEAFNLIGPDYPSHLPQNANKSQQLFDTLTNCGLTFLGLLHDRIAIFQKLPQISVIIPIYNAYEHVTTLLESINQSEPWLHFYIVNDSSTDKRIDDLLTSFAQRIPNCTIVHNTTNLGFVATCNLAMQQTAPADVILLNSDTVVPEDFAKQLAIAAYSDTTIGTVTPLSNNASIFSVLQGVTPQNQVYRYLQTATSLPREITIPTGVGFCLYIKREVLDTVGYFDPVFGKGYGEETELCQRIRVSGYRNVLTTRTFVYHSGKASMVAAGVIDSELSTRPAAETIINSRFPEYGELTRTFMATGVIDDLRSQCEVDYLNWLKVQRPVIVYLLHNPLFRGAIGGTEKHVKDLIDHFKNDYFFVCLSPSPDGRLNIELTADGLYKHHETMMGISDTIANLKPNLVHIHHLMGIDGSAIRSLIGIKCSLFITLHDYFSVCESYTLIDYRDRFCGVPSAEYCGACAKSLFNGTFNDIARRRSDFQSLFDRADLIISPSKTAVEIHARAFDLPEHKLVIINHPYPTRQAIAISNSNKSNAHGEIQYPVDKGTKLRIAFVGYRAPQKGSSLQNQIISALRDDPVSFVFIGAEGTDQANVKFTGHYSLGEATEIIKFEKPDVALFTSPWPETFSYTLSETWAAGVPVVVPPIGALMERVKSFGGGIVTANISTAAFIKVIRQLIANPKLLEVHRNAISEPAWRGSWHEYEQLYNDISFNRLESVPFLMTNPEYRPQAVSQTFPPLIVSVLRARERLIPSGTLRERLYLGFRKRIAGY
jgi:glycosyltransferase involved in cell wall biosynthesis/SAM-dependent methyltransferase